MKLKKSYLIILLFSSGLIFSQEEIKPLKKVGLALLTEPAPSNPSVVQAIQLQTRPETGSVSSWYDGTQRRDPLQILTPQISYKDFSWFLNEFIKTQKHFLYTAQWVSSPINTDDPKLKDSSLPNYIRPCVLKLATQPDSRIFFWEICMAMLEL